ncbi:MAG: hypothetical protein P4N59_11575 [Negativicutes bacterium]|nr:hypothetical protein [Negativicutes bacterium]
MTMRIASFILPYHHPRGEARYTESHQYARCRLLETFGGYTTTETYGAWKDGAGRVISDTSLRYDVAHDWQGADLKTFIAIARFTGSIEAQECVLIVDPWGNVTLPDCKVNPLPGYHHTRI